MESPIGATYRAIRDKLISTPEVWGNKVYPDRAAATATKPYVVVFELDGRIRNIVKSPSARFVIGVKGVANSFEEATSIAGRILELLDGAELYGGPDWKVTLVSAGQAIHFQEAVKESLYTYTEGYQFRIWLERKG